MNALRWTLATAMAAVAAMLVLATASALAQEATAREAAEYRTGLPRGSQPLRTERHELVEFKPAS